jgi:hypothetical protein
MVVVLARFGLTVMMSSSRAREWVRCRPAVSEVGTGWNWTAPAIGSSSFGAFPIPWGCSVLTATVSASTAPGLVCVSFRVISTSPARAPRALRSVKVVLASSARVEGRPS